MERLTLPQYDLYVEAIRAKMGKGDGKPAGEQHAGNVGAQERRAAERG